MVVTVARLGVCQRPDGLVTRRSCSSRPRYVGVSLLWLVSLAIVSFFHKVQTPETNIKFVGLILALGMFDQLIRFSHHPLI